MCVCVCVCVLSHVFLFDVLVNPFHNKMLKIKSACLMKNVIMETQFFKEVDDLCNSTKYLLTLINAYYGACTDKIKVRIAMQKPQPALRCS